MVSALSSQTDRRAVIVCSHVASGKCPILRAVRDDPVAAEDSGWQFRCAVTEDDPEFAKVWLVCEILNLDPSLAPFIDCPPGTVLARANSSSPWEIDRPEQQTGN